MIKAQKLVPQQTPTIVNIPKLFDTFSSILLIVSKIFTSF